MLSLTLNENLTRNLNEFNNSLAVALAALSPLAETEKLALREFVRVSTIGASTRIENAILTDPEILWIDTLLSKVGHTTAFRQMEVGIRDKLSKDKERSIEEVAGCRDMLMTIYDQSGDLLPLSATTLRGLHQQLMAYYPAATHYAGRYKQITNSVVERHGLTGHEKIVFQTADPGPITETAMSDLIGWYNRARDECAWGFAVACEFVFRFLAIHPFQDGNGRLGRGLFLLVLLQSHDKILKSMAPYLVIDRHIERHRAEYYRILQLCSGGRFTPDTKSYHMEYFLKFMLRMTELAIRDINVIRGKYAAIESLSLAATRVWECLKNFPEKRMQSGDIVIATTLPRRTIANALQKLVQLELVQKKGRGPSTRYQIVF